ncbi:MAG TPA: fibronectin type III domain-containing protein [Chloroflexota bacterium]|nr:fibronectin type III domain-containing protein [Chloroflexota bacterium]
MFHILFFPPRRALWLSVSAALLACGGLLLGLVEWQASQAQNCDVRLTLDNPAEGASVEPQQMVSGWAADLAAPDGTGINAIVVSLDGALDSPDNRLIGVAEYGAPRPDIAEMLGDERFTASGFTLLWDTTTTPSGPHQLVVQAHTACGWQALSRPIIVSGGIAGATTPVAGAVAPATLTPGPAAVAVTTPTRSAPSGVVGGLVVTPGLLTPVPTSMAVKAPENLRLLATTTNGVTLAWDPPSAETPAGYLVHESYVLPGGANAPGIVIARLPATTTTVTITGLLDPTKYTYYFTVSALGPGGTASPYAASYVTTTPPGTRVALPPTPPATGLGAVGGAPTPAGSTPGPAGAPQPASTLLPGAVGATAASTGTPTAAVAAVVGTPTPTPGGPFTATATAAGNSAVTVSWNPQVGAAAYNVYGTSLVIVNTPPAPAPGPNPLLGSPPVQGTSPLASATPGTWVPVLNNVQGNSALVTNLTPGGSYAFVVRAVNSAGQEFSQSVTAPQVALPLVADTSSVAPAGAPAVGTPGTGPAGTGFTLTASPTSNAGVALSWTPLPGATTYAVLVSRGGSGFIPDPLRAALTTTSTTIEGLTPGSQLVFQVVARDAAGNELGRSNPAPVTVSTPLPPGPLGTGPYPPAPTYLATPAVPAAAGGATLTLTSNPSNPGTANLQWTPLPGAASYDVWMAPAGGTLQLRIPATTNAAAYLSDLAPGQYTFQVHARDANGNEIAVSNPVTVTVLPRT